MTDKTTIELRHTTAAEEWANSPERVPLFAVTRVLELDPIDLAEGQVDDRPREARVEYTMPAKPNAGLSLKYLKMARQTNADVAMSWLIETAVGSEGYDALADELAGYDDPDEAIKVMQGITERIQRVAMGGLDPKASARS